MCKLLVCVVSLSILGGHFVLAKISQGLVYPRTKFEVLCTAIRVSTVKPLITDPPNSGLHLCNGQITCPRLTLP